MREIIEKYAHCWGLQSSQLTTWANFICFWISCDMTESFSTATQWTLWTFNCCFQDQEWTFQQIWPEKSKRSDNVEVCLPTTRYLTTPWEQRACIIHSRCSCFIGLGTWKNKNIYKISMLISELCKLIKIHKPWLLKMSQENLNLLCVEQKIDALN